MSKEQGEDIVDYVEQLNENHIEYETLEYIEYRVKCACKKVGLYKFPKDTIFIEGQCCFCERHFLAGWEDPSQSTASVDFYKAGHVPVPLEPIWYE